MIKLASSVLLAVAPLLPTNALQKPSIAVTQVPPEALPSPTCREGEAGYLEHMDSNGNLTNYSENEIGAYVADHVKVGQVVTVYPQVSGKIFVITTCSNH